jgi:hypothetical protein
VDEKSAPQEVADYFGTVRSTAYGEIAAGNLPTKRFGKAGIRALEPAFQGVSRNSREKCKNRERVLGLWFS